MKEGNISKLVHMEASKHGAVLFRNHVGGFYDKDGRFHKTGLCKGSSDLIGWTKDGFFLAIEVKKDKGKVSPEQQNFIDRVNEAGGIGFIARSPEDVKKYLTQ